MAVITTRALVCCFEMTACVTYQATQEVSTSPLTPGTLCCQSRPCVFQMQSFNHCTVNVGEGL